MMEMMFLVDTHLLGMLFSLHNHLIYVNDKPYSVYS